MSLRLKLAHPRDAHLIATILTEASNYKGAYHNDDSWKSQRTGSYDYADEEALGYINRGDTYLALLADEVIGTIALQRDDTSVWGPKLPGEAVYVHRLAISNSWRGKCYGAQLINLAQQEANNRGCRFLRLDVPATNRRLRDYYEGLGFVYKGMSAIPLRLKETPELAFRAALYELKT